MAYTESPKPFSGEVFVRPGIEARTSRSDHIGILLGGGTIFSQVRDGVRIGGYQSSVTSFLISKFPDFGGHIILPHEHFIYGGLSENMNPTDFDDIEVKVVRALNADRSCDAFLFFVGSDMCEAIGSGLFASSLNELEENRIRIYLVWANEPIPHPEAVHHCRRALQTTREPHEGGIYIISGNDVIPAMHAAKESWHGHPMKFYDRLLPALQYEEEIRRWMYAQLADTLSQDFFKVNFSQLIAIMTQEKHGNMIPIQGKGKKRIDRIFPFGQTREYQRLLLEELQTSPIHHPIDATGAVVVKHLNEPSDTLTESEFADCKAAIVVLNHSATTRRDLAQILAAICQKRRDAGKPLLLFAVTETGEPRHWNVLEGLYPSGMLLRNYVVLIPGHIKPTLVKLWAGVHRFGFELSQLIDFMTTNFRGEVVGKVHEENLKMLKANLRIL